MGYRGKLEERARARELRARAWTLQEIADELGVAKSSVSTWVRDVDFVARPRPRVAARRGVEHPLRRAKLDQIARLDQQGRDRVGSLTDREFLLTGVALYACEGAKGDRQFHFANSDARLIGFMCAWLRRFFALDESRLRCRLYLHEGLDLDAATAFWSAVTDVPAGQFGKPYRPVPRDGRRHSKHVYGCLAVTYGSTEVHREVMGLVRALVVAPQQMGAPELGDPRGRSW